MLKTSRADTYFLVITFLVVALLGIPTYSSLVEEDGVQTQAASVKPKSADQRVPASIPTKIEAPAASAFHMKTEMDLSCGKKLASLLKVSGGFMQLHGKSCVKNFNSENVEIINRSNGYTASIFDSGKNKYQTDLIQLVQGENEITVRYQDASGKTQEEVLKVLSSQI
ncbi:hypothetical protein D3C72_1189820 [compost metagenome]